MMESQSAVRLIEVNVMEAKAVSNDKVLENKSADAVEEQHATNEELSQQVLIEEEKLMQDKVIEEAFIS